MTASTLRPTAAQHIMSLTSTPSVHHNKTYCLCSTYPSTCWKDIRDWIELTPCEAIRLSQDRVTCSKIIFGPNGCLTSIKKKILMVTANTTASTTLFLFNRSTFYASAPNCVARGIMFLSCSSVPAFVHPNLHHRCTL